MATVDPTGRLTNSPWGVIAAATHPSWVSDALFPFESLFFITAEGHQMHYVYEGPGPAIVFVHGNPTWSFEFRHLISGLRSEYRLHSQQQIYWRSAFPWHKVQLKIDVIPTILAQSPPND